MYSSLYSTSRPINHDYCMKWKIFRLLNYLGNNVNSHLYILYTYILRTIFHLMLNNLDTWKKNIAPALAIIKQINILYMNKLTNKNAIYYHVHTQTIILIYTKLTMVTTINKKKLLIDTPSETIIYKIKNCV